MLAVGCGAHTNGSENTPGCPRWGAPRPHKATAELVRLGREKSRRRRPERAGGAGVKRLEGDRQMTLTPGSNGPFLCGIAVVSQLGKELDNVCCIVELQRVHIVATGGRHGRLEAL